MRHRIDDRCVKRSTRWRVSVAGAAALGVLASAACGASGPGESAPGGQADVAAAKTAIAAYQGHPSAFPVSEPLSKPLPAGTRFVYLQCSTTACGLIGNLIRPAIAAVGGTLSSVNASSTAQASQAAVSSALALKPDAVIITGIDPSLFGDGLKALSAAGIKVVSLSISKDVKPFGITFNYIGSQLTLQNGKLLADWVIANKGANADVVFYGVPALDFSGPMQKAFEDEMKKNCPSCKVRTDPIGLATIGTTSARTVVTDLQAHPSTNVAVFASSEVAAGLPAAMKAAGLSITTLGYAPTPGNLQDIKDGGLTAGLAIDFPVSVWTGVDAAARLIEGGQPVPGQQAGQVPTQFLEQKDITFDPTRGWSGYPDYQQRFTQLWHPAR